jgi:hypothetical protein
LGRRSVTWAICWPATVMGYSSVISLLIASPDFGF